MIYSLEIKNFILIENFNIEFTNKLCVITGDTGAGKSILLDAINFCFGKKISGNPVRKGQDYCIVTVECANSKSISEYLAENGVIISSDETIIISTRQALDGRKKIYVNNQLVSQKIVQILYDNLIELHGQNNHTSLLNSAKHIELLDDYADIGKLKTELKRNYNEILFYKKKIDEFYLNKKAIEDEIEYYKHIINELEEADIKAGEEQELLDLKRKLNNYSKDKLLIETALSAIKDCSVENIILNIQKNISKLEHENIDKISVALETAFEKIDFSNNLLQAILNDLDFPDIPLEDIDERLYLIKNLIRKNNVSSDDLPHALENYKIKLAELESTENQSIFDEKQLNLTKEKYYILAQKIHELRLQSAKKLERKIMEELKFLDMKKASFKIEILTDNDFLLPLGIDKVRFLASTNPGSEMGPIDKIASGGELSRMMLALRVALFDSAPKTSIIFDEIDVGISGSVADSLGHHIKHLSEIVQTLVITHQPQVAGKADQHILIYKTQHQDHTISEAKNLDKEGRVIELARMISGKKITDAAILAAKELIL